MRSYPAYGSRIDIDDRYVRIVHTAAGPSARPDVAIPLNTVTGAVIHRPSMFKSGQFQITTSAVGLTTSSPFDPCTVLFTRAQEQQFYALADWFQHLANVNRLLGSGFRRALLTRRPTSNPSYENKFTALHLETTGLDPHDDQIVEIGLVKFAHNNDAPDEFATLVKSPGSSREAREIHQIDDNDLIDAPTVSEVLPEVFALMSGSFLVTHNLDFVEPFLLAAAHRNRIPLPAVPALCTLRTCRRQLEGRSFSLRTMHEAATDGVVTMDHTALSHARATREVLLWLMRVAPEPLYLTEPPPLASTAVESLGKCRISYRPVQSYQASLSDLLNSYPQSKTPRKGDDAAIWQYKQLLDRCTEDCRLSLDEVTALREQAHLTRLTGTQLRKLHTDAWRAAFADEADSDWSTLTPLQRREMLLLADALGLTDLAKRVQIVIDSLSEPPPPPEAHYLRGLRIGIAGDDPRLTAIRQRAEAYGGKIAVNITKTVNWLASTNPDSTDKHHAAARALAIPILTPEVASERLEQAIREGEFEAFERQRQRDEIEARQRQWQTEHQAYWRPTWRRQELDRDPDPGFLD